MSSKCFNPLQTNTQSPNMTHKTDQQSDNALTAHKVSDVVFHAKPRTNSFLWTGSALARLIISPATGEYVDPLHATHAGKHTCTESIYYTQL